MKRIQISLTDEEYADLQHAHQNSAYSTKPLTFFCRQQILTPKVIEKRCIDEETKEQLKSLQEIMAVYEFFAEKASQPEIYKYFSEYNERIQNKLNLLM